MKLTLGNRNRPLAEAVMAASTIHEISMAQMFAKASTPVANRESVSVLFEQRVIRGIA